MKLANLLYIFILTTFNTFATEAELSDGYKQLRQKVTMELNAPYSKCLKKSNYETYKKVYNECRPGAHTQGMIIRCENLALKATKFKKGATNPSAHCNILKPREKDIIDALDKIAQAKDIKK